MERKSMDHCLKRLKQELLSMKEAGDGLHDQMNCMMGALQELKLLQVQTALEQLEISGGQGNVPDNGWNQGSTNRKGEPKTKQGTNRLDRKSVKGNLFEVSRFTTFSSPVYLPAPLKAPTSTTTSKGIQEPMVTSPGDMVSKVAYRDNKACSSLTSTYYSQSEEAQSTDIDLGKPPAVAFTNTLQNFPENKCKDYGVSDDTSDWTSSLMSQGRNRQPLVLGDNIFADLVGNWLDLPELEKKSEKHENCLTITRPQEFYKKFSLTTNIFKKFLRTVKPDKDKLLKEKPCWLPQEDPETELSKRSKKNRMKGTFYFPFHANPQNAYNKNGKFIKSSEGNRGKNNNSTKKSPEVIDKDQPAFDMNTAVWV
ncbi:PAK4-inhibitor INKA2 [Latimeria chalumnae]|uniref:PAK4-inhibitor INKA2 n=1 Tax=Latimeria chalumnae TaxID=7897 RepID=UPI0003C186EF|nr:PREDICTED: protein FAM212B isoform X2 [Latimeria chalumnae]|eukprot:XP_005987708.1 PREDICTED: protein FAM212B isoform X2 [Latimeria chalumnae]